SPLMETKSTIDGSRRKFIYNLGLTTLGISSFASIYSCTGSTKNQNQKTPLNTEKRKLGIALVGLGAYAGGQLAPALQQTEHCYLAGIVTGSPSKIPEWKEKYNIPDKNIYNYENFDSIKDNPDIDIIYVV